MTQAERLVRRMLAALLQASADHPGVTRDAYGAGEAIAHAIAEAEARALEAEVATDAAGNLYMTLPGADRMRPAFLTGSHLDSVPHGGNFDGAAGVVAGLAAMADLRERGITPPQDLTVVAFRAEEAAWFPLSYPGSLAALGLLPPGALQARRSDTGRTLADHMAAAGFDPDAVARGEARITPDRVAAFVEVHIEQGPVLVGRGLPLGLVTAINGGFRHMTARITGDWAHSGATPYGYRRDAALAAADLIMRLQGWWAEREAAGEALTVTFGCLATDPALHGGSRVAGDMSFALDIRAGTQATLDRAAQALRRIADEVARAQEVAIDLGPRFDWDAAACDPALVGRMADVATHLQLPHLRMPSGAGHDTAALAGAGIPSAMIFVRNANGSHNPDEAMDEADLDLAVRLLARLAETACELPSDAAGDGKAAV
ncbi:MAG: hydantoinase/carbamoylase family amidase [Paracoccaceae bacterium]|nr:MAG: hydantoinase/carbamoylase family amidase [Paracoccaceae bacterium]